MTLGRLRIASLIAGIAIGIWTIVGLGGARVSAGAAERGAAALREAGLLRAAGAAKSGAKGAASDEATIVLVDGTEIHGKIIEETDKGVKVRCAWGVTTVERAKIKEIRRGDNPLRGEFEEKFKEAGKVGTAEAFLKLADWARDNGLDVEMRRALGKVIEIDPNNETARSDLGHARLDGKWIEDQRRIDELIRQGYHFKGLDLIPPDNKNAAKEAPKPESAGESEGGSEKSHRTVVRKLSPREQAKLDRERAKRRKAAEAFQHKKELEHIGVPWEKRFRIKTAHYDVECDSTYEVARMYGNIMEALYGELRRRFTQPLQRSQRLPILIYKTHEEFMDKTGMPAGVGGFYTRDGTEQVRAYHGTFGFTATTFNVLAHEGTHQFEGRVLKKFDNLPIWIIEGLATYFGDGSKIDYEKGKIVTGIIPRDRLLHIQRKMREGTNEPLRRLCELPQRKYGGSQYADGWSLVYFLFEDHKRGIPFISRYWMLGMDRKVQRSDFIGLAKIYYGSLENMEKEWIKYTLSLKPESAGKVEGDTFTSDEFKFDVRLPSDRWFFVKDDKSAPAKEGMESVLVSMEVPKTDARIVVGFTNNNESLDSREFVSRYRKHLEKRGCTDIVVEQSTMGAQDAAKITLRNLQPWFGEPETPPESAGKKADPKGQGGDPKGGEKPGANGGKAGTGAKDGPANLEYSKYRVYVLVGISKVYLIVGACHEKEFPQYEADFDQVAKNFELILQNRW